MRDGDLWTCPENMEVLKCSNSPIVKTVLSLVEKSSVFTCLFPSDFSLCFSSLSSKLNPRIRTSRERKLSTANIESNCSSRWIKEI